MGRSTRMSCPKPRRPRGRRCSGKRSRSALRSPSLPPSSDRCSCSVDCRQTRCPLRVCQTRCRSVVDRPRMGFGYNPPTGDRLIESVRPETFRDDLDRVLSLAAPAFDSIWVSDHFMTNDKFRLECWTQLTWIAARYPGPLLGTIVLANSYRHPPLLAKMAASIQYLSGGRFILGYG